MTDTDNLAGSAVMTEDCNCAKCGFPKREHHHDGACYCVCGEFVDTWENRGKSEAVIVNWKARALAAEAQVARLREHANHVLDFLDALAANMKPDQRKPLNPILIGGSAKLVAEGFRAALTPTETGERELTAAEMREACAKRADAFFERYVGARRQSPVQAQRDALDSKLAVAAEIGDAIRALPLKNGDAK